MNQATSNLADRKELQGAVGNERLLQPEGQGDTKVIPRKRAGWMLPRYIPLAGAHKADYLTSTDQLKFHLCQRCRGN